MPKVVSGYADIVHATYLDTLAAARELQSRIQELIAQPSAATLASARKAWLDAREWYGQTEAFRFYGGPIDDESGPEGRLNAWPLDEAYIDGVEDQPEAGMINDRNLPISREVLMEANERGGEENISTGWHAIEFLLWGQDLAEDGPGKRQFSDFVDGKGPNAHRRRQYLEVVTALLVDDLQGLADAWVPGQKNYRADFEQGGAESVRKIIVGLGSLSRGELAGERLEVPASTQDQEDEHSCFSDNTHRDVVGNARGIANVWHGRYRRRDGTDLATASLQALVAAADAGLAQRTTSRVAASVAAAEALEAPFDREIIGDDDAPGRRRVRKVIDNLVQQSKDLVEAAAGITSSRFADETCTEAQADCLAAPRGGHTGRLSEGPDRAPAAGLPATEIDDATFDQVVFYVTTLAPPARRALGDPQVTRGERLFHEAQCAVCHRPSYVTARPPLADRFAQFSSPALEGQSIHPYTDLLLHDMGDALADGRPDNRADGRQWRTPPLWGVGMLQEVNGHQRLLHDGRARGVLEAVMWHGGEAAASREQVRALSAADREALVRFVESL